MTESRRYSLTFYGIIIVGVLVATIGSSLAIASALKQNWLLAVIGAVIWGVSCIVFGNAAGEYRRLNKPKEPK